MPIDKRADQPAPWHQRLAPAFSRQVVRKAIIAAILVGSLLILLNQGDLLFSGQITGGVIIKCLITPLIPFCVTMLGTVLNSGSATRPEDLPPRLGRDSPKPHHCRHRRQCHHHRESNRSDHGRQPRATHAAENRHHADCPLLCLAIRRVSRLPQRLGLAFSGLTTILLYLVQFKGPGRQGRIRLFGGFFLQLFELFTHQGAALFFLRHRLLKQIVLFPLLGLEILKGFVKRCPTGLFPVFVGVQDTHGVTIHHQGRLAARTRQLGRFIWCCHTNPRNRKVGTNLHGIILVIVYQKPAGLKKAVVVKAFTPVV